MFWSISFAQFIGRYKICLFWLRFLFVLYSLSFCSQGQHFDIFMDNVDMVYKQTNKCFIVNQDAHNEKYNE